MPITTFFQAANRVLLDQFSNAVSLIDLLEGFETPNFPLLINRVSLVWIKNKQEGEETACTFDLVVQHAGRDLGTYPVYVDYLDQSAHRSLLTLNGLVLEGPGEMTFRILDGESEVARLSVTANQLAPAPTEESTS